MAQSVDSQLAVINSGQWQEAVFTTYALSLTFFESCLLPALRHARCEKATIFADIDGYRSSLMERRSASAGREYAVVPVQVRNGIFHPKCTYLCGKERDALLVGSGNLTFGGHGKNVEVLEILLSDTNPRSFLEFADFIASMLARGDLYFADRATVESLGQRARHAGRRAAGTPSGPIELLHSTERSFQTQLTERLPSAGDVKQVVVLSPYHHPTGQPILELVKATGAKELLVGVPSDGSPTSFPLAEAKRWKVIVQCVRPHVTNKKRGLHAKWWEIRGRNETLTLTGSINATLESFATTNNIEVGVLRRLKKPLADVWDEVEAPEYEKDEFHRGDAGGVGAIYAAVDGEGRVKGQLLGVAEPAGEWVAHFEDGPSDDRKVQVSAEGSFSWRDSKLLTATRTLQLEMQTVTKIARGWLSNEAVLRMPSRSRAVAQAVVRMLLREETSDDVDAMFDYIATETAAALAEAPAATVHPPGQRTGPALDEVIKRSELDYAGSSAEERLVKGLATPTSSPAHRLSILDSIAAVLLGGSSTGRGKGKGAPEQTQRGRGEETEDDEETAAKSARQDALDRFNEVMQSHLENTKASGRLLGIAMRIWLNVNLDMLLRRLGSREAGWLYGRKWVGHVLQFRLDEESRGLLSESFCGLAGGLLMRASKLREANAAVSEVSLTPRIVHDWLDRFFDGAPAPEKALELATRWSDHDLAQSMLLDDRAAALEAVRVALATPTARQIVASLVAAQAAGTRIDISDGIFAPDVLKSLELVQRAPKDRPVHRVVQGELPESCPKCFVQLIPDTLARLRVNRVADCMICHVVIVWLGSNHETH